MDIALNEANNGQTIKAAVNDRAVVTLSYLPSSGFLWQSVDDSAGVLKFIKSYGGDEKPGSPGHLKFIFQITNSGYLQLNLARPWDELQPPVKFWWVKIEIS